MAAAGSNTIGWSEEEEQTAADLVRRGLRAKSSRFRAPTARAFVTNTGPAITVPRSLPLAATPSSSPRHRQNARRIRVGRLRWPPLAAAEIPTEAVALEVRVDAQSQIPMPFVQWTIVSSL